MLNELVSKLPPNCGVVSPTTSVAASEKFIVFADEENSVYLDSGNGAGLNGVVELTV